MREIWKSFLTMSVKEAVTGAALGAFMAFVFGYTILGMDLARDFWWAMAFSVCSVILCMGVIAWARIQPKPDIDNRPESKREP